MAFWCFWHHLGFAAWIPCHFGAGWLRGRGKRQEKGNVHAKRTEMERGVGLSRWLEARVLLWRLTLLVIPKHRSLQDLKRKGLRQLVGTKPNPERCPKLTPERCPVTFWSCVLFLFMLLSLHVNVPCSYKAMKCSFAGCFLPFFCLLDNPL